MGNEQLPLFPSKSSKGGRTEIIPVTSVPLTASSPLTTGVRAFHDHMRRQGLSPHTIKAFGGDLNIFVRYVGAQVTLGEISTAAIHRFLDFLRFERGVPCNLKSFQRRVTTLKVFFNWLRQTGVLTDDPAAPVAHLPASTPLPQVLYEEQVAKLLSAARQMRERRERDARPYLLLTLLLSTGIKKSEAMTIRLQDIDLSNPLQGVLYVRYDNARKRHKERKLKLPADFSQSYDEYREQYHPREHLFECTARNLEYVLADLAKQTGLGDTVSFETLRWTCAVRDLEKGMPEDLLRQKLGLSPITWEDAGEKLRRLAAKPL
jgi:integrase/recombinase XerD